MSTLRCTNLQDTSGSNSLTTAQIYNGAAKAWVNFNGTGTVAIRAQFNVSSITDNGTGNYTVNFSTAMPDANYCAVACSSRTDSANGYGNVYSAAAAPAAGSLRVTARITTNADPNDQAYFFVAIFR